MHPAAELQLERVIDEYAQWRAITEAERPPAPAWWWGPALDVRELATALPASSCRRLGLPDAATYSDAAKLLLGSLAGQSSMPWPYDFSRKVISTDSDVRDLHPQPSDDSAFQP
ncbi:hypothetical protein [Bradyrhizobium sp.]|uniref:hypothetical protein n=1 Tax=Bradyrhizobium sp. TaxID=376 RepID=UPI00403815DA